MNQRTSRIAIKICGVRDRATVDVAAGAGADFVGVVLVASSPRFVSPTIAPTIALAIADAGAMPVAVVRLPIDPETRAALDAFPILQFHGIEEPDDLTRFSSSDAPWELWKGLHFSVEATTAWLASGRVRRVVVDGPDAGSGEAFDHNVFAALDDSVRARCMLAGGLDPAHVAEVIRVARPGGVDVSSGVESARGIKDHEKIREFIRAVREA